PSCDERSYSRRNDCMPRWVCRRARTASTKPRARTCTRCAASAGRRAAASSSRTASASSRRYCARTRARSGGTIWSTPRVYAASGRGARSLAGGAFTLGDLLAHVFHVERLRLLDDLLERALRQRPGLREHDDLLAEDHQRRNRADLE